MQELIYHITTRNNWRTAQDLEIYRDKSLDLEGFIHCSTAGQVVEVANRFYRGEKSLVLLCIDTDRVEPSIVFENLEGGDELYPHVYGPIALDAVIRVAEFRWTDQGFRFPSDA